MRSKALFIRVLRDIVKTLNSINATIIDLAKIAKKQFKLGINTYKRIDELNQKFDKAFLNSNPHKPYISEKQFEELCGPIHSKEQKPVLCCTPFEHVQYTLVRSQEQLNAILNHENDPFLSMGRICQVTCMNLDKSKACCIVQLGDTTGLTQIEVYGLLVHESVHIWQMTREQMGEKLPGEEFEAYSVQRIAMDLMDMYEKSNPAKVEVKKLA